MIRCAIVGFGWWGQTLATRLATSTTITVTRIVDGSPQGRAAAADKGFAVSAALEEALVDPSLDAVIVATPNSFHEAQVIACAKAGKHVFCEKPLGLTLESARRSVTACAEAGVILGIGHERRFEPALERLRAMVLGGELGTILHADCAFSHDKLANLSKDNWRKDPKENPAAGMTATGVHLTDFLIWTFGPVRYVSAMVISALSDWECGLSCQLSFANGATGVISSILATPHDIHTRIYGTTGWAEVVNEMHPDFPEGKVHLTVQRTGEAPQTTSFPWVDSVKANLEEFAAAVEQRQQYRFTHEQLLQNVAILEAAHLSATERRVVELTQVG